MADDRIAEMIAQPNAALAATLAGALQGLRSPHIPSLKLSRFMGHPKRGGDPTVAEWLQEFDVYARQTGVMDVDRAVALLESPGQYLKEMGHPDLLVIDLGSNDLTCVHSTVAEVADDALRFLALLDDDVHPKMIIVLSVIQRTSVNDRGGMTMSTSTFNRRSKAFNSRIAACVRQIANVRMFAQSRINFPRYISDDGCHLTEEGQARYIKGLRQAGLTFLALC